MVSRAETPAGTQRRPTAQDGTRPPVDSARRPDARRWPAGLVIAGYLAVALAVTFPFVVFPTSTVLAPIGFDVTGSIAKFGELRTEGLTPFSDGRLTGIGWPDGVETTPTVDIASFLSSGLLSLLTLLVGSIAAHGLLVLSGYVLTASVTFLYVRRITGSLGAGLVAGTAYGFFPYMYLAAWSAPQYTHMWLYLLPLWATTEMIVRPSGRSALLAGASVLPALFWTPYYSGHIAVIACACGVVAAVLVPLWHPEAPLRRIVPAAVAPVLLGLVALLGIGVLSGFDEVPQRDPADAYALSAHPGMFVTPGLYSWWGDAAFDQLAEAVPRAASQNLYLGLSVIALAAVGLVGAGRLAWRTRWRPSEPRDRAVVAGALLAAATVLVSLAFSGPPTTRVLGVTVSTPADLLTSLVPALRGSVRFVMPMMGGMSVLAGIGAAQLLARRRAAVAVALSIGLALLVFADLRARPIDAVSRVRESAALETLRRAPEGVAVHYTAGSETGGLLDGLVARPCVYRPQHDKTLVNTCSTTAFTNLMASVADPFACTTVGRLAAADVRYVIVDRAVGAFANCQAQGARIEPLASDDMFMVWTVADRRTPPREPAAAGSESGGGGESSSATLAP